jgi:hypothetical protein
LKFGPTTQAVVNNDATTATSDDWGDGNLVDLQARRRPSRKVPPTGPF